MKWPGGGHVFPSSDSAVNVVTFSVGKAINSLGVLTSPDIPQLFAQPEPHRDMVHTRKGFFLIVNPKSREA